MTGEKQIPDRGRTCKRAQVKKMTTSDQPDRRLLEPKLGAYPALIQLAISSTTMDYYDSRSLEPATL